MRERLVKPAKVTCEGSVRERIPLRLEHEML